MTYLEFFGHYSLDELENFGKPVPPAKVCVPPRVSESPSLLSDYIYASQFSNRTVNDVVIPVTPSSPKMHPDRKLDWPDEPYMRMPGDEDDEFESHHDITHVDSFEYDEINDLQETPKINPCTGLPEINNSGIDAGGHVMYACEDDSICDFEDTSTFDCHSDFDSFDSFDTDSSFDDWMD